MSRWLSAILEYWQAGGLLLIPLALVHLAIWMHFFHLRAHMLGLLRSSEPLTLRLTNLPDGTSTEHVQSALAMTPGGLSDLLRQALNEIMQGGAPAEIFPRREEQARRLWRRDLITLGALTAVAPLLGLLGTVVGMIYTFDAVSGGAGNVFRSVADGISTALITTQFGLIIALPGVFGLARLNRLMRTLEVRLAECCSLIAVAFHSDPAEANR